MSKGLKIMGWLVFVLCLGGGVTFGVLAYQQHTKVMEYLEYEQAMGLIDCGIVNPGEQLFDDILEGHELYTQAYSSMMTYSLIGGGILVGGLLILFVDLLVYGKRK